MQPFTGIRRCSLVYRLHASHGENRGSSPLGSANKINNLQCRRSLVSNKCPINGGAQAWTFVHIDPRRPAAQGWTELGRGRQDAVSTRRNPIYFVATSPMAAARTVSGFCRNLAPVGVRRPSRGRRFTARRMAQEYLAMYRSLADRSDRHLRLVVDRAPAL